MAGTINLLKISDDTWTPNVNRNGAASRANPSYGQLMAMREEGVGLETT